MSSLFSKKVFSPGISCLVICLLLFLVRMIIAAHTGLGIDESYNVRGVVNIRAWYIDHPPLFFWLSYLSAKLFGLNPLGLRLPSILLFFGTSLLVYDSGRYLFNRQSGLFSVLLLNLSFIFTLPVATWFQPDAPLIFFWMLTIWSAIHLFFPKDESASWFSKWKNYLFWILAGLSIGLAILSKFHSVFLVAGILLFIFTNKRYYFWFKHPAPYLALVIMALPLLPFIIRNIENGWIPLTIQGTRALPGKTFTLHPDWLLRNITGQAIWLLPWIWWWLVKQLVSTAKKMKREAEQAFFFWLAVIPILFFTLITLWADTQFRFHWQSPGYLALFIPLGHYFAEKAKTNPGWVKKRLLTGFILLALLSGIMLLHMNTGFWQWWGPGKITKMTGGSYDPTLEGVDFDEIRSRFEQENWLENRNIFVGGVRWWQAGKTDWALRCQKEMVVFDSNISNYTLYQKPAKLLGKDAVIIRFPEKNGQPDVGRYFDSVTRLKDIDIVRGGRTELSLEVFYCKNFHIPGDGEKDYLFGVK